MQQNATLQKTPAEPPPATSGRAGTCRSEGGEPLRFCCSLGGGARTTGSESAIYQRLTPLSAAVFALFFDVCFGFRAWDFGFCFYPTAPRRKLGNSTSQEVTVMNVQDYLD